MEDPSDVPSAIDYEANLNQVKHLEDHADRLDEKYVFFKSSLALTILGLSVQTAKLGQHDWSDFIQLLGWTVLLVSASSGIQSIQTLIHRIKARANAFAAGNTSAFYDYATKYSNHGVWLKRWKNTHTICLFVGIVLVAVSRMIPAISYLWTRII